jgi:hypothetical protein
MSRLGNKKSVSFLKNGSVYPTVSHDIVRHLQSQGKTLKEIGELMGGLSESFISRVLHKQRSFTLRHLSALETALSKPYPIIIIEATRVDSVPKGLREAYAAFRKVLVEFAMARTSTST